ncbi:hypothetical protein SD457_21585 [Coprobacillaceae bacterium CR2/5/TPMF4]|nr:hypothetical protein SD457_21585 [Coprobacillaceae bacterium CR2/5/TPMF4]
MQKQGIMLQDIVNNLSRDKINPDSLSKVISQTIYQHLDFIKYHQILNAIIETNVTVEKLAEFKLKSHKQMTSLFNILERVLQKTEYKFTIYT